MSLSAENRALVERVKLKSMKVGYSVRDVVVSMRSDDLDAILNAARAAGPVRPQPIETAPKDVNEPILASTTGKVWFQCTWDDDDSWVTFNRYLESDVHQPDRAWRPTMWIPLPATHAKDPQP